MRIYWITSAYVSEDGQAFYATKAEAVSSAKEAAKLSCVDVQVFRADITLAKSNIVALANRRGWALNHQNIFTAKAKVHA